VRSLFGLALAAVVASAGCGYRVSGHSDLLPKDIKTIAIPAFANGTTRYRLTDRLPAAIAREFLSRTRYNVVADPNEADAVLTGTVLNLFSNPTIFDPVTGRASGVQVSVFLELTLRTRDGKVIYNQPGFEYRQRYEISTDQEAFFDESDSALDRLGRDVARTVVSAVLETF
jgi:hypothetical protein